MNTGFLVFAVAVAIAFFYGNFCYSGVARDFPSDRSAKLVWTFIDLSSFTPLINHTYVFGSSDARDTVITCLEMLVWTRLMIAEYPYLTPNITDALKTNPRPGTYQECMPIQPLYEHVLDFMMRGRGGFAIVTFSLTSPL